MRMRTRLGSMTAAAAALLMMAAPADASPASEPDPAPGGPQRAHEPDVEGPRNIDTLSVSVTSDGGARNGLRVGFHRTSRTEPDGPPAAARRFVFLFDDSLAFRPEAFPVCPRRVIERRGVTGCPPASQVGRGTAHAYPSGVSEVLAFNTRHANGLRGALVVIPSTGAILELTWEKVTPYYQRLGYRWALDEILPPTSVPPGQRVGTSRFELVWGAVRRSGERAVSFAESRARPGAELRFGLWSEFVTGQVVLPRATAVRP
ncbi:hypothetical protein ACLGIH_01260 [Streptomyces sp. HMX87]|uniref:hypothetical protein n=1 Tax=Streptomyces sp. HMX87 TaxID=3390849 RepID=UPI003A88660B